MGRVAWSVKTFRVMRLGYATLSLALLMFGINANNIKLAASFDKFALITNFLD